MTTTSPPMTVPLKAGETGARIENYIFFVISRLVLQAVGQVFNTESSNPRHEDAYHPCARRYFEPVKPFKSSFSALKKSALDGCHVCHYIQQLLGNEPDISVVKSEEEHDEYPVSFRWWASGFMEGGGTFEINRKDDERHIFKSVSVEISTDREKHNMWSPNRNIEINPVSDKAVLLMKLWLQNCLDNHPDCTVEDCRTHAICGRSPTPVLPTRVIDVGSENIPPRLIISDGRRGQYAALSHCWGNFTRTTTTKDAIQQMMQGLPLPEFSATFRDAIIVCRRLEIPYLWIDSLCIIQDDKEDWIREASNMTAIYAHSYITLATARNTDSSQSFLRQRSAMLAGCEVNPSLGLFIRTVTAGWGDNVLYTKYNSRAWCFQEQQLPTRVLYFTEQELMWNCKHGPQHEALLEDFDMQNERLTRLFDKWQSQPVARVSIEATSWYQIIGEYTRKEMTFPEDRLPALSGMAAQVQRATGSQYLAGLWRDSLVIGLLWRRSYISGFLTQATVDSGPSWSWASYYGGINYDLLLFGEGEGENLPPEKYDDEDCGEEEEEEEDNPSNNPQDLITIISAQTTLLDTRYPTGRVTSGTITLRGLCQTFTYAQLLSKTNANANSKSHSSISLSIPTAIFDLDPSLPSSAIQHTDQLTYLLCRVSPNITTTTPPRDDVQVERSGKDEDKDKEKEMYALELELEPEPSCYIVYGLILRAVAVEREREDGVCVYRRLGRGEATLTLDLDLDGDGGKEKGRVLLGDVLEMWVCEERIVEIV